MSVLIYISLIVGIPFCSGAPYQAQFDHELHRLAEILGGLHHLRGICATNKNRNWRDMMQELVDAEAPSGPRRADLIASFNRGYGAFQLIYRKCTPSAQIAIRRHLLEGLRLSSNLIEFYSD
ncbi:TIGR02301 family protein [Bradyrhizobium sp. 83012]|uniref:TIGR02301 family protein n=2 Tax=Bradyrhizobium aeschynomenes TaxID=2734909 RepID=A0ABX2CND4_9BRAD|nr:TIGR02301 family protein [Bradyrhizobium aeschynomenes]NPU15654.1 TIGR02301 family protein [Bradyrhizobium aeschynomenes]NPU69711.1 TIGR02301 family protein [Bradyrhizobium aeschynomenes]NPV24652.1 TIGR02301 family protein [Bradyrhizobium aeschynomenes]